jgi:hypothetical protein
VARTGWCGRTARARIPYLVVLARPEQLQRDEGRDEPADRERAHAQEHPDDTTLDCYHGKGELAVVIKVGPTRAHLQVCGSGRRPRRRP